MTPILYPPSRPQSVGEVLDTGFRIFTASLVKCLPYAALAVVSGQLPTLYQVAMGRSLLQAAQQRYRDPVWWLLEVLAIVGTITLSNALLMRQHALATGRAAATGTELTRGLRLVPGVLLIGLIIVLAMLPSGMLAAFCVGGLRGYTSGAVIMLAVLVALTPAAWLLVRWSCSVTTLVVIGRPALDSMSHSWRLTGGSLWRLSLIYTVALILIVVLYVLSGIVSGIVSLLIARGDIAVFTATATAIVVLLGAIATPFYSALALAVLGDLSVRKEGGDLAQRIAAPAMQ